VWQARNLFGDQISTRYLNPRLRYHYFRFLKTNGFYFRYTFWPIYRYRIAVLHRATKFHPKRTTRSRYCTLCAWFLVLEDGTRRLVSSALNIRFSGRYDVNQQLYQHTEHGTFNDTGLTGTRAVRIELFTAQVLCRASYQVLEYSADTESGY